MAEITIMGETLEEIRDALQERIGFNMTLGPAVEPDPTWALKQRIKDYVKFRTFVNGGNCNADNGYDAQKPATESRFNAGAIAGCEDLLRHLLDGDFDGPDFNERVFGGPRGDQFRCTYNGIIR